MNSRQVEYLAACKSYRETRKAVDELNASVQTASEYVRRGLQNNLMMPLADKEKEELNNLPTSSQLLSTVEAMDLAHRRMVEKWHAMPDEEKSGFCSPERLRADLAALNK